MAGVMLNATAQLLLKAGTNRVGEFAFALENVIPIGTKLAFNPFILGRPRLLRGERGRLDPGRCRACR